MNTGLGFCNFTDPLKGLPPVSKKPILHPIEPKKSTLDPVLERAVIDDLLKPILPIEKDPVKEEKPEVEYCFKKLQPFFYFFVLVLSSAALYTTVKEH